MTPGYIEKVYYYAVVMINSLHYPMLVHATRYIVG